MASVKHRRANEIVEDLRVDTRLYVPALTARRGFSSTRVEHLLNRLVREMPDDEAYLEVGTLEGRTLEAASVDNPSKTLYGCDPCSKYDMSPEPFAKNVRFYAIPWQEFLGYQEKPLGLVFYDGLHDAEETCAFMDKVIPHLANEAVLVLDDWDRESVRAGAFQAVDNGAWRAWQLLRECPEWTDGLTTAPHHFGYSFGVGIFGYRRT